MEVEEEIVREIGAGRIGGGCGGGERGGAIEWPHPTLR